VAARTDNVTDPGLARALLLARRGQAFYSRKLNELADHEFDGPSLLPGWSRRQLIAHVGLNARALTRLTAWATTGIETPMYDSPGQRVQEIDLSATLPVQALRNLSDHAAIHLNVEWRDMPESAWAHEVRTALGRQVAASETVWMRTREVWIHAVDLNNGATFADFPASLVDELLEDVLRVWRRRQTSEDVPNVTFVPTDRASRVVVDEHRSEAFTLRGTAAQLAAWATGRGIGGVSTTSGREVVDPPPWL
jgi:maleylpyruvate isomerase